MRAHSIYTTKYTLHDKQSTKPTANSSTVLDLLSPKSPEHGSATTINTNDERFVTGRSRTNQFVSPFRRRNQYRTKKPRVNSSRRQWPTTLHEKRNPPAHRVFFLPSSRTFETLLDLTVRNDDSYHCNSQCSSPISSLRLYSTAAMSEDICVSITAAATL